MASTLTAPPTVDDRVSSRSLGARLLSRPEVGSLVGAVVVLVFFLIVAPPFRELATTGTILYQSALIGVMAVPVALLMIGGEFDLSAGVAVTTAGLTGGLFAYQFSTNVWVGVGVSLVVMISIGAFNGWLLMRTGLPSFLVTLGTFFILQGLNLGVTRVLSGTVSSNSISDMDGFSSAQAVFASEFKLGPLNVKILVVWWIVFVAIGTWVLLKTKVGNWIFAVGGDAAAARAVGVPVKRVKIGLFITVGFFAWFSGMHLLFNQAVVQSGEGVGKEFIYIIAAVVGGCLLTGGYGSVVGSAIGALIFGMTQLGVVYAGWNADWFKAFLGVMLLLATIVNLAVKKRADLR
ncbi:simple sugar transport system permease protein [Kribbella orskensis]|uniref:Xylose transport system permease protein XylH n=1 Tax=Kribbella orskensis TaxID=2512216 RepID=A0ABY2BV25_9ACTN|nr:MULTISPECIES: ABC transporter permease [Kribbella]TCN44396.1 simple sugar transport system permease protein [Kribbella sp. VKM Ac-2500]TCO31826.1 simple sugar transport system permease protein [Kribbella orskensis]